MAAVPLQNVPISARTAWLALRDELQRILRDDLVVAGEMARFIAFVRERLVPTEHRPADALPRWSGY